MPKIISRAEAREQGLKKYYTGKPCKHGHIAERITINGLCYICSRAIIKKYLLSEKGKVVTKEAHKTPAAKKSRKKYLLSEKGKVVTKEAHKTPAAKKSRKKYLLSEKGKAVWKKANKKFYDNNPLYRMANNLRSQISHQLNGIKAVKEKHFFELVGCNSEQLKSHLEYQFLINMSWDNYGKWHVDHIVPVAYFIKNFDFSKAETQQIAYNYSNLQPIWANENTSKGAKISKSNAEKKIAEIKKLINA